MNTKAYIFDLDGTLLDSMNVWKNIDIDFLKKRGIIVPNDYADAISAMTFQEAASYTRERFSLPDTDDDIVREWFGTASFLYKNSIPLKPYAKEYLFALRERGLKIALATSAAPELYRNALQNHGIHDWFDALCDATETGCGKSRPDIFLLAAKKLQCAPADCLVFEDILAAVKSAKSVGMRVCGIYDEASPNDWQIIKEIADYALFDFQDAPLPN
jgi:HAD superfamily hydrolase (TIGR01509 family)